MATRLNPYISFNGNARQALEFYQRVLGGQLVMSTFGEFGQADTPIADQIMHGMLETDSGFALMCSDTPPGMSYNPGDNFSVSLSGDDAEELRGYWDRLTAEGTVAVPLEKQMWGDEFGMVTDQFGISWLVNIAGKPEA
ncbi:VOC family protein [Pseudonocardiaceae bacterium YIM PH 21723]|nr:VOC family protein [Pseudonocardiaceae bacterium YIM PH 21723]